MSSPAPQDSLRRTIAAARRRLLLGAALSRLFTCALWTLPAGSLLIAADQRWFEGQWTLYIAGATVGLAVLIPVIASAARRTSPLSYALVVDHHASLKDRISSAWEFLHTSNMDEPRLLQVRDAIRHAEALDMGALFRLRLPARTLLVPGIAALFALSFLVPPSRTGADPASDPDPAQQLKLAELDSLEVDLTRRAEGHEEIQEVLDELKQLKTEFERQEVSDRDVMIGLARLDERLQEESNRLGAENLAGELDSLIPHLMASTAAQPVAASLRQKQLQRAADEMEKLGHRAKAGEISQKELAQLGLNMRIAASKLDSGAQSSFHGDLAAASESLEGSDLDGFNAAASSVGNKFRMLDKWFRLEQARKRIALGKSALGQAGARFRMAGGGDSGRDGAGARRGNAAGARSENQGTQEGGLEAGRGSTGTPFGDPNRLADSYRKLVGVTGVLGDGPIESEVETTEGASSAARRSVAEVYAEYASVAERAIERQEIPLSHRFHVKRYFQVIRPVE